MTMRTSSKALILAIGLAAACQDPPVKLGSENNVQVTNSPGYFRLQVANMDNVIDELNYTWVSADSQARVIHNSLIPHGEADIEVRAADSTVVYSGILDYEKDSITKPPAPPGSWFINIKILGATGKIDLTLETPP